MIALFVIDPWPTFYERGMKTWEIRSYPINYRGEVLITSSRTNKVICSMELIDCVPLTKELWEMNFEKHRTSCSYENLPYRQNNKQAYIWILKNPKIYDKEIKINRTNKKPYIEIDNNIIKNVSYKQPSIINERLACKFIDDLMLIFWIKKNYLALIGILNLSYGNFELITTDIKENEIEYIISQINAS